MEPLKTCEEQSTDRMIRFSYFLELVLSYGRHHPFMRTESETKTSRMPPAFKPSKLSTAGSRESSRAPVVHAALYPAAPYGSFVLCTLIFIDRLDCTLPYSPSPTHLSKTHLKSQMGGQAPMLLREGE